MITPQMIADAAGSAKLGSAYGPARTAMNSLTVYSATQISEPVAALFEPRFYVLLQGAKHMQIGGQDLIMQPGGCALSALGLPFHTEVIEASQDKPYLGVAFTLNPALVSEVLLTAPDMAEEASSAFEASVVTAELVEPVARLLALLRSPADIPALAPLFERELVYRLCQGPMSRVLRLAARSPTRFAQVRSAAEWIRTHADEPMRIDALAGQVGMSLTSLHRHFRAVTGTTPLAYQRHIRLLAARERILSASQTVTSAAFASGYASTSQFSREYKRMFGVTPVRDRPRRSVMR